MNVRTWLPDPSHYPEQLTPLSATVWLSAIGHGLHEAMRELQAPFGGFEPRTERGWAYEGELDPDWEIDNQRFESAAEDIERRWETELRPRVHEITDQLHRLRPEGSDAEGAVDVLRRMQELVREQWTIHFLAVIPAQIAVEIFEQEYTREVGQDAFRLYRLLDEVENDTNRADAQLWELADRARALDVADIIREFPPAAAADRLRVTAHGRQFLHQLDAYLLRFGGRSRWHELSLPREVEQPWMTFQSLRLLLEGEPVPPVTGRSHADSEEILESHPTLRVGLRRAQFAYALKEGHVHHIDYPGLLATREVLHGMGRRLFAAGILEHVDDVWMLDVEQLENVLSDASTVDIEGVVATRRHELEIGRREGPRPYLGEPPANIERHAALTKFYGTASTGPSDDDLRGTGASPGTIEGTARVIRSTEDFSRISRGDVLVVATTTPAWTPLFPSLAALITETGGVLCHGAIVAREYAIPAVVGVHGAMDRIPDGARVRVDGASGEIELL